MAPDTVGAGRARGQETATDVPPERVAASGPAPPPDSDTVP